MFESITDSLGKVFDRMRGKRLTEEMIREAMREVRLALLEADVAHTVVRDFTKRVTESAVGEEVIKSVRPDEMVVKIVHDELVALLGGKAAALRYEAGPKPTVIMFCGLQGSGKTTTVGKLAMRLLNEGHKPLLVAADVQRPAAIQQLKTLGIQVGVPVYSELNCDPITICTRSLEVASLHKADVIILDTAGRLHVDDSLMTQLEGIAEATQPTEILLVLDAMTGQDAISSTAEFSRRIKLTGAILTKLDGDARGGAALSLCEVTGVPIKFVGVGEKLDALEEFFPERMAGRILGMGDIVSLVERAQANVDLDEQQKMQEKLLKNEFTLEDFQKQLAQIRKMGSIKDLLSMIPGLGKQLKGVDVDEGEFKRIECIIQSMTSGEKNHPEILCQSRKERIAKGAGVSLVDISQLLKQFKQMRKMIGQMNKSGLLGGLLGGGAASSDETMDHADFSDLSGLAMNGFPRGQSDTKAKKDKRKERKKEKQKKKRRK